MDEYIEKEISNLKRKIVYLRKLKVRLRNETSDRELSGMFDGIYNQIHSRFSTDMDEFNNINDSLRFHAIKTSPNPDQWDKNFYGKMLLGCSSVFWDNESYGYLWWWTGRWVTLGKYIDKPIDPLPENVIIVESDSYFRRKLRMEVPAVVQKFKFSRFGRIEARVIYMINGERHTCDVLLDNDRDKKEYLYRIEEPKLQKWVLRHTINKIRGHIRRWREHLKYRPGSEGYVESETNFKNTINNLK